MRELTLDDGFWRDALTALRDPSGGGRLERAWPGYAGLVEELATAARGEGCLVGGRPATAGKNPRLFLAIVAAALAREGIETLYLDLSSELRWLEMLTGEDLKEGLVDHLQYEVPLDRCVRRTAFPRLSVLTGGAHFLAGSPLEDAPAFRAALETLRGRYEAVVAAFPHPFDAAESAGVTTLCDAWIAIEEGEVQASLTGSERAVVELVGDPQAAWDLARLSSAFLGPLPVVLASRGASPPSGGAGAERAAEPSRERGDREADEGDDVLAGFPVFGMPEEEPADLEGLPPPDETEEAGSPNETSAAGEERPVEDEEEVAFLRAFEGAMPPARERSSAAGDPDDARRAAREEDLDDWRLPDEARRDPAVAASAPARPRIPEPARRGIGRGGVIAASVGAGVVALLLVGFFADLFDPLWAGSGEEPDWAIEVDEPVAGDGDGTMVALDSPADTGAPAGTVADGSDADGGEAEPAPVAIEGEPAPYSLHVGSYQSPESGGRVVRRLEEIGQTAFLAPVDLGERGRWYRVYAGAFADSASAGRALESILGRDLVEEGAVRRTPWAFRLGAHETREAAEAEVAELAADGISAYATGDGPAVVWAGAFRSEDEAATMAATLEEAGAEAVLVERDRPR